MARTQLLELWREVFEAADNALELGPAERQAFFDGYRADHPAVGAELIALIDAAAAASTLETPAAEFAASFLHDRAGHDELGLSTGGNGDVSMFGPYRVLREVGSGGMAPYISPNVLTISIKKK